MWRLLFMALLVVAAIVAYEREWVTFSWQKQGDGKTEAGVTFDNNKVKQDIQGIQQRAREAVKPAPRTTLRGVVESLQANELRVRSADETVVRVRLTEKTMFHKNDRAIAAGDIHPGDSVTITSADADGGPQASSVVVDK